MSRHDLTDFERRVIKPLLPNKPGGVPRVDDRRVPNELRNYGAFNYVRGPADGRGQFMR
jgi:transposase